MQIRDGIDIWRMVERIDDVMMAVYVARLTSKEREKILSQMEPAFRSAAEKIESPYEFFKWAVDYAVREIKKAKAN